VRAAGWIEDIGRADDQAELVAHHYTAALLLGAADDRIAVRARQALRRAGDRALRLNAFERAKAFYAEALALAPADDERPYLLFGHAQAGYHADGAADAELVEAVGALERIGDLETAAQAAALASEGAWRGGRHVEAREHVVAARAMLEGREPSRALVAVLAQTARLAVMANRREEASAVSDEALRLAEELGLDALRASVLTTLATAEFGDGNLEEAKALLTQAVGLSEPTGSPEAARALVNLAVIASSAGSRDDWRQRTTRAAEYAARIGDRRTLLWLDPFEIRGAFVDGDWDQAMTRAQAFLDKADALGGHYSARGIYLMRAWVLAARGRASAAAEDLERGLDGLAEMPDTQVVIPANLLAAAVSLMLGEEERAADLLDVALVHAREAPHRAPAIGAEVVVAMVMLGRADAWLTHLAPAADTWRIVAARLLLSGRPSEAADIYAANRTPTEEASARLLAARQFAAAGQRAEADVQLQRALAFYRAVGAVRVVAEAGELLAAAG
jgi:tetratricopeptide (TPR) repeat protein